MSRDFEDAENGGSALQKYFRDRQSCYIRNVPDGCRQRASAAASSVLSRGRRSTSEIPASASRVDTEIDRGCGVKQHGLAPRDLVQRVSQAKHILSLRCVAHEDITLEQSAGGLPADHWPPCGRRSSAVSPPAVCSELLRLHGFPCGCPLACSRIAWMKTNRMAKKMAKRRVKSGMVITRGVSMKRTPAKARAKVSGIQMMHCELE